MERLAVEKFHGVGRVTAAKMKTMGLHTGADLKMLSLTEMIHHFGKPGTFYYQIVRGIDNRPVQPDRETKSVSVEDTYQEDLTDKDTMFAELEILCQRLAERLQRFELRGRTVTVKFKFHDFIINTRSLSLPQFIHTKESIVPAVKIILDKMSLDDKKVRLLGVALSNFDIPPETKKEETQLKLF